MTYKKLYLFIAVLLCASPAFAQQVLQQTIDVNAHVIAKLAIVSTANVDLGTIVSGQTSTLPPNASSNHPATNVGTGATPGQITISGAAGERISVTYSQAILTNSSGASAIFLPAVADGATLLSSGNEVSFPAASPAAIVLDIGGILTTVPSGSEGTYSTTNAGGSPITFSFTYTSI